MIDLAMATGSDAARQMAHWRSALDRLGRLDTLAAPDAWSGLEGYLGAALRRSLGDAIERTRAVLREAEAAQHAGDMSRFRRAILTFRRRFDRLESVTDFYVDALNTRGTPYMNAMLRCCDRIAEQAMAQLLVPIGRSRPPVLVFVDKGLGAAILKAGLRLWDGSTENPAAAIKVTFHNLLRPTSILHEAGHQIGHMLNWNDELGTALTRAMPSPWGEVWASWASEIVADAYAFVHAGYASIAAMHDVLDGDREIVYRFTPGDPHPITFLRVLLGVAMCRVAFGRGGWDGLGEGWSARFPAPQAPELLRPMIERSLPALDTAARVVLHEKYVALGGRALIEWIDPARVAPSALLELQRTAGEALYTSPYWAREEGVRIVALSGYRVATDPRNASALLAQQEAWMLTAGGLHTS